jgi:pimeloyl-ACP methyl ester carboxylesterase
MADAISCALILVMMNLKPGRTSGMNARVCRLLLVFVAAYPPWSIAEKKFPVLSIAAELDGLATLEKVLSSLPNLPPTAQLEVIPGGIHALFWR